jgi:MerR family copper efflux transcriptional regulator
MGKTSILSKDEFLKRAGLTEDVLDRWLSLGLMVPVGRTAGKISFFLPEQLLRVEKIRSLQKLGYEESIIAKIAKTVGLPSEGGNPSQVPEKLRTVGELAQACDVNSRTIKHWEEKGLLEPDARSEGGFRLYAPSGVLRFKRILDLQNLGYTLEEIRSLKELLEDTDTLSEIVKSDLTPEAIDLLARHNEDLKRRIEAVRESVKRLDDLVKKRSKASSSLRSHLAKQQKSKKS